MKRVLLRLRCLLIVATIVDLKMHMDACTGVAAGLVACECGKFPIVGRILHLRFGVAGDCLVELINEERRLDDASLLLSRADIGYKAARFVDTG